MKNEGKAKMIADQCRPCTNDFYSGFYQGALIALNAESKYFNKTGIELIAQERKEQIEKHGWSIEHDKDYSNGQLIQAAEFCREQAYNSTTGCKTEACKWPDGWIKHFENKVRSKDFVSQLIVAGAFYMAENDRLESTKYQSIIDLVANQIDKFNGF